MTGAGRAPGSEGGVSFGAGARPSLSSPAPPAGQLLESKAQPGALPFASPPTPSPAAPDPRELCRAGARPLGQLWGRGRGPGNEPVDSGRVDCASWHVPAAAGSDGTGLALKLSKARGQSASLQTSGLQPTSLWAGGGRRNSWTGELLRGSDSV